MSESTESGTSRPPLCQHLRHKGMYVYTDGSHEGEEDPGSTIFWCQKTFKSLGPDDDMVDRECCRAPERTCYEPS